MKILMAAIVSAIAVICMYGQTAAQSSAIPQELTTAQREACEELNRAAAAYKAGNFTEAQQHSERALSLDPTNKTAIVYLARIIHTRYKPSDDSAENVQRARAAIAAYQKILTYDPQNEEAYKAIAILYAAIHEEQLLQDWVLQRASNPALPAAKRAEAYVILAGKGWDCSFRITELPDNKVVETVGNNQVVVFRKPKDDLDFLKANQCVTSGLEMVEMAIAFDPDSESAWSYKTNLLIESSKLAEMEGRNDEKAIALKASKEAGTQAFRLAEERRRRESAELLDYSLTDRPLPPPRVSEPPRDTPRDIADGLSEKIIFGADLDNAVVSKPDAIYPPIAKAAHASGTVRIEIVVDESGNVIRARAVSGHPLLQAAAVAAARQATFVPHSSQSQAFKVRGFLTYEFRLP